MMYLYYKTVEHFRASATIRVLRQLIIIYCITITVPYWDNIPNSLSLFCLAIVCVSVGVGVYCLVVEEFFLCV